MAFYYRGISIYYSYYLLGNIMANFERPEEENEPRLSDDPMLTDPLRDVPVYDEGMLGPDDPETLAKQKERLEEELKSENLDNVGRKSIEAQLAIIEEKEHRVHSDNQ